MQLYHPSSSTLTHFWKSGNHGNVKIHWKSGNDLYNNLLARPPTTSPAPSTSAGPPDHRRRLGLGPRHGAQWLGQLPGHRPGRSHAPLRRRSREARLLGDERVLHGPHGR